MRLHDPLDYWARRKPELPLVAGDAAISYGEAAAVTSAWAVRLRELGLAPGDHLALASGNHLNAVLMIMAASKAGLISVPMNPRLLARDYSLFLLDSGAKAVVGSQSRADALTEASAELEMPRIVLDGPRDGWDHVATWPRSTTAEPPRSDTRLALRSYTSGTTGRPKAAELPHDVMVPIAARWSQGGMRLQPGETFYIPLPIMLWAGLMMVEYTAWCGGAIQLDDFTPERALAALRRPDVVAATFVPTMIDMMLEVQRAQPTPGTHDVPAAASLRWLLYGGTPASPSLVRHITDTFGADLFQCYGCTEASVMALLTPEDHVRALDGDADLLTSVGRATIDCDLIVLGEDDLPVGPGEVGEICTRGHHVFDGYVDADKNAAAFRDGWYHTGDLGSMDADGYLYLRGRKDHMIKTGGINVYPEEIERLIAAHPDVLNVAVVGLPDERWGTRIVAAVERRSESSLTEDQVIASCRASLASYKVPREVTFVDRLPLNATGKVLKHAVRDLLDARVTSR